MPASEIRNQLRPASPRLAAERAKRESDEAHTERLQHNARGVIEAIQVGQQITLTPEQLAAAAKLSLSQGHINRRQSERLAAVVGPMPVMVLAAPKMTCEHADGTRGEVTGLHGTVRVTGELEDQPVVFVARIRELGRPVLPCPPRLGPVFRHPRGPSWAPRTC